MKVFILSYDRKDIESKELLEKVVKLLLKNGVRNLSKPLGSTIIFRAAPGQTYEYWNTKIDEKLREYCYYLIGEIAFYVDDFNFYATQKYKDDSQYSESTETFGELIERMKDELSLEED